MRRATDLAVPVHTLFWFILSHFVAVRPLKCAPQPKIAKKYSNTYFGGLRLFKVTDVNKDKKLVTSAVYDKQHVYAYLQLFSR